MATYTFISFSNPVAGRADEYNEWFDTQHLTDMLSLPGVVAARRFKVVSAKPGQGDLPWSYAAQYQIETDDIRVVFEILAQRAGTELMPLSDALDPKRRGFLLESI